MVNAEAIQLTMLRAKRRRRDTSALYAYHRNHLRSGAIYWNSFKLKQSTVNDLHSKSSGGPTVELAPP